MAGVVRRAYRQYRQDGMKAAARELASPRNALGDALWSIRRHRYVFGGLPNLLAPKRFNEHLLRVKLSRDGRSSLRGEISDKELVKRFVEGKLGPGFTPETFAVLRSEQEVAGYRFPSTCAVKPTHSSGQVVLRRDDPGEPDLSEILSWFDLDLYEAGREPNYRLLQPKVIVEELLSDAEQEVPLDYKVFCFRGNPALIQVDVDRFATHRRGLYSPGWRELAFGFLYPQLDAPSPRPSLLDPMLDAARCLSEDFSFIRVDFYLLGSRLLVGELTNFPENCWGRFFPDRADHLAGQLFRRPDTDVERLFGVREPRERDGLAVSAAE